MKRLFILMILFTITGILVFCSPNILGNPNTTGKSIITTNIIYKILSSSGADVVNSYNLTDSQETQFIDDERFYIPLFTCEKIHSYIGFDGSQIDTTNDIRQKSLNPYSVTPFDGTYIKFNNNFSFKTGENIIGFKTKFGEGTYEEYSNLQGDDTTYHLTYNIDSLQIEFSSYDKDFAKYMVNFTLQ